jgi:hypothetical protein
MSTRRTPVTDPEILERIETAFMFDVYRARRLAWRRLHGDAPAPARRARLLQWHRAVLGRPGGYELD